MATTPARNTSTKDADKDADKTDNKPADPTADPTNNPDNTEETEETEPPYDYGELVPVSTDDLTQGLHYDEFPWAGY